MSIDPVSHNPAINPVADSSGAAPGSPIKLSMSQGVASFAQLQKMAPKVAEAMMQAIVQTTINQMNNSMDRIHQSNQQARYQNG